MTPATEPLSLTFVHDRGVEVLLPGGRVLERTAVRAVALRGREVLLLRTAEHALLKFPGGGVEAGESHAEALARELDEECGMALVEVGAPLARTMQLARAKEPGVDVFRMTSHYLACTVGDGTGVQRLEAYERRLGLRPEWVDLDRACADNEAGLATPGAPRWVARELAVLRGLATMVG